MQDALSRGEFRAALVVGDRLDTDIAGANAAQLPSLMVLTGVNNANDAVHAVPDQRPTYIAHDLRWLHTDTEACAVAAHPRGVCASMARPSPWRPPARTPVTTDCRSCAPRPGRSGMPAPARPGTRCGPGMTPRRRRCSVGPSASVGADMSTDADQIRAQFDALLAEVPDVTHGGADLDDVATRLEQAHDVLVQALESVEKG